MSASVVFIEKEVSMRCISGRQVSVSNDRLCLITQPDNFVETNEFRVPGSEVVVKLRQPDNAISSDSLPVQVVLVQPENDIIKAGMNGTKGCKHGPVLRSSNKSLIFVPPCNSVDFGSYLAYHMPFKLKVIDCHWKQSFLNLTPDVPADVTIRCDGHDIPTTKTILTEKSDVFATTFTHDTEEKRTGVVKIADFSFPVVQEMVRFLMHGYCTQWDGQCEQLTAIADKYNIIGMQELADEKKELLDLHP